MPVVKLLRLASLLVVLALPATLPLLRATQDKATTQAKDQNARPIKLVLKDGTYQLVRTYERNGDRVRYMSAERGEWEELPATLVDWDATAKAKEDEEKSATGLLSKVQAQERAQNMAPPIDVDASLRVGTGAFLPEGEGMFVVEGKTIRLLGQVGSRTKTDTKRMIISVLSPVPGVPGKINVEIPGARALIRLRTDTPEFYLREAPPNQDAPSRIAKSSRPGESGPEVELIRAEVHGHNRRLQSVSTLFGQAMDSKIHEISVQRWEIAPNVYRFTLSEPLTPGEYVLAEVLPDGLNLFVWDFGLDSADDKKPPK